MNALQASCDPSAEFPAKVDAGLNAVMTLAAAEPALVGALFAPSGDPDVLEAQQRWRGALAEELRSAALGETPPDLVPPPIVEPFLVAGIGHHAARLIDAGQAGRLRPAVPDLVSMILTYYYASPAAARAAAGASGT